MDRENQSEALAHDPAGKEAGLDLAQVLGALWQNRKFAFGGIALGLVIAAVVAHLAPPTYTVTAVLRPNTQSSQISNLLSASGALGLGGISGMLGGDQQSDFDAFSTLLGGDAVATYLAKARPAILHTIWSSDWDPATHSWKRAWYKAYTIDLVRQLLGYPAWTPPGPEELESYLSKKVDAATDFKTSQLTMTYTGENPEFARNLVVWEYEAADQIARREVLIRANDRISYLEGELSKPTRPDMHDVLIELLTKEEQQKMMAEADEYYSMLVVQRPVLLPKPTGPSVPIMLAAGALLGMLAGIGFAYGKRFLPGRTRLVERSKATAVGRGRLGEATRP